LELYLLGLPRPERDGVSLQFDTRKILAFVVYLALSGSGQGLRREALVALLRPDVEPRRARPVLHRDLSLLRRAPEGDRTPEWPMHIDSEELVARGIRVEGAGRHRRVAVPKKRRSRVVR
jgi:DNA-binding SARP family transcriptional activator